MQHDKEFANVRKIILLISALAVGQLTQAHAQQMPTPGVVATPSVAGVTPLSSPGYLVSNWYLPWPASTITGGSWVNSGAGEVGCYYGYVQQQLTISNLGVDVTTPDSGGNIQLSIYSNGSWGRPSAPVVSTSSISTTTTGLKSATASAQIGPGGYWFCSNMDNTTSIVVSYAPTMGNTSAIVGSASDGNVISASGAITGIKTAQSFGTWPTFTSGTTWSDITASATPVITFEVASVP